MSRDEEHGGGSWGFSQCVWAPTQKEGGGHWPFWDKVGQIKEGDTILHLKGIPPDASFVGYSVASGDGFATTSRPPDPKAWSFSSMFYRADLRDFVPFVHSINLRDIFLNRREQLEAYFESNKADVAFVGVFMLDRCFEASMCGLLGFLFYRFTFGLPSRCYFGVHLPLQPNNGVRSATSR